MLRKILSKLTAPFKSSSKRADTKSAPAGKSGRGTHRDGHGHGSGSGHGRHEKKRGQGDTAKPAAARHALISPVVTSSSSAGPGHRSAAEAAARRLCAAARLVNVLSRTMALYSSGPVTPSMWNRPSAP